MVCVNKKQSIFTETRRALDRVVLEFPRTETTVFFQGEKGVGALTEVSFIYSCVFQNVLYGVIYIFVFTSKRSANERVTNTLTA